MSSRPRPCHRLSLGRAMLGTIRTRGTSSSASRPRDQQCYGRRMMRTLGLLAVVAATLAVPACGSSAGAPDASVDAYPAAPHTAYPQMPDQGGHRLAHPQLVTVTFANDPRSATLESFAQ